MEVIYFSTIEAIRELITIPEFKEWFNPNEFDEIQYDMRTKQHLPIMSWFDIYTWLMEYNWHIIIFPEFYKDGINYNVQIAHYNPNSYKVEWEKTDDKSAIVYKECTDVRTSLYGDNGEFSTYLDALKYGIKWCINIIKTGKTDLV